MPSKSKVKDEESPPAKADGGKAAKTPESGKRNHDTTRRATFSLIMSFAKLLKVEVRCVELRVLCAACFKLTQPLFSWGHHQGKLKELDGKESKLNDSQRRFASLWILALWCNQESPEPTEFEGKVRPLGAVRGWQQGGNRRRRLTCSRACSCIRQHRAAAQQRKRLETFLLSPSGDDKVLDPFHGLAKAMSSQLKLSEPLTAAELRECTEYYKVKGNDRLKGVNEAKLTEVLQKRGVTMKQLATALFGASLFKHFEELKADVAAVTKTPQTPAETEGSEAAAEREAGPSTGRRAARPSPRTEEKKQASETEETPAAKASGGKTKKTPASKTKKSDAAGAAASTEKEKKEDAGKTQGEAAAAAAEARAEEDDDEGEDDDDGTDLSDLLKSLGISEEVDGNLGVLSQLRSMSLQQEAPEAPEADDEAEWLQQLEQISRPDVNAVCDYATALNRAILAVGDVDDVDTWGDCELMPDEELMALLRMPSAPTEAASATATPAPAPKD